MQMAHRHREEDIRVDSTAPQWKVFGLFEFLGDLPMYSRVLYQMYAYARITAVHIKMEIVNTGTVPLTATMCPIPFVDSPAGTGSTLVPGAAAEYPRAVTTQIGTATGMSKAQLSRTWAAFDQLGQPVFASNFWVDEPQAAATTPNDVRQPIIYCVVDATDPTLTWSANITYTLTFHVQWFDLKRNVPDELSEVVTIQSKPISMAKRK